MQTQASKFINEMRGIWIDKNPGAENAIQQIVTWQGSRKCTSSRDGEKGNLYILPDNSRVFIAHHGGMVQLGKFLRKN